MKRLLVLCGGQSPEHSISIRSCKNILRAIDREKYSVTLVGITVSGSWILLNEQELREEVRVNGKNIEIRPGYQDSLWCHGESLGYFDAAFPILHGPNGEDGSIQGLLQLLGMPFVGPGILSSAVCMDKEVTKRLLKESEIGVADWITLFPSDQLGFDEVASRLGMPVYIKPANMGSSVGVHKVDSQPKWEQAIKDAFKYDQKVLVERSVQGREVECAVLGNHEVKASGVGEVKSLGFYSYDEKYADSSSAEVVIPAQINEKFLPLLKDTAIKAYKVLGCEGMSRVDMFLTPEGKVLVNEVNTIPGFTSISMYPKLWEQEGVSYTELIDELISLAMK